MTATFKTSSFVSHCLSLSFIFGKLISTVHARVCVYVCSHVNICELRLLGSLVADTPWHKRSRILKAHNMIYASLYIPIHFLFLILLCFKYLSNGKNE